VDASIGVAVYNAIRSGLVPVKHDICEDPIAVLASYRTVPCGHTWVRQVGESKSYLPNTKDTLTLNLLTTTIVAPHSNACKWQMGFNSAFKGLRTIT